MVEIFKTNIDNTFESKRIIDLLLEKFPNYNINFDLDDCDKILRVEADYILINDVISILKLNNFYCEILN